MAAALTIGSARIKRRQEGKMDRLAGGPAAAESASTAGMGNMRRTSILCRRRYPTRSAEEAHYAPTRA
jgi:hypothetical protein